MSFHLMCRNGAEREQLSAAVRDWLSQNEGVYLPDLLLFFDPDTNDVCVVELPADQAVALKNPGLSAAERRHLMIEAAAEALADRDIQAGRSSPDYGVVH